MQDNKYTLLIMSIAFDAIGMLSFTIPVIGEFSDVIWAPLSTYFLTRMFAGTIGKIGGMVNFIEEALPGVDIIPTFTLTWIYKYLIKDV